MVLFNLSKLELLIDYIHNCPAGIPKRDEILFKTYTSFEWKSAHTISIEIPELEKIVEKHIDDETSSCKKKIIQRVVHMYTVAPHQFPPRTATRYLMPSGVHCDVCDGVLEIVRPSRKGRSVVVYTKQGPLTGVAFHKHCSRCDSDVYYNYHEFYFADEKMRKYSNVNLPYFSCTQDTYFETDLLEELSEDLFTSDVRFSSFVTKYNRVYCKTSGPPLVRQRILPAWILHSIGKRIPLQFPVFRKEDRAFDIEECCKYLYPSLKQEVDARWLRHSCERCRSKLCVMDGNQKCYRLRKFY